MKRFFALTLFLGLFLAVGAAGINAQRPRDPWVFHIVLDDKPNAVVAALHPQLWIAYDTWTASLYKAWNGDVNFQGAVYTGSHGPQPTSRGVPYYTEGAGPAWRVRWRGREIYPDPQWRGYRFENNLVVFQIEIRLEDGSLIRIDEIPEAVVESGSLGLVRFFRVVQAPPDAEISVALPVGALNYRHEVLGSIEQSGGVDWLVLQHERPTVITTYFDEAGD